MKLSMLMLVLALSACVSSNGKEGANNAAVDESSSAYEELSQRVYFLQHKLISKWLFETEGDFFYDMQIGRIEKLLTAATEIVSQEYSEGIYVTPVENSHAVLITFPIPQKIANCFYALLLKDESGYHYYTYEKTIPMGDLSIAGVVGGWDSEENHHNYGPRTYTGASDFVKDVLTL